MHYRKFKFIPLHDDVGSIVITMEDSEIIFKIDIKTTINQLENLVKELKNYQIDNLDKWKNEFEKRRNIALQSEAVEGFAGEDKPENLKEQIKNTLHNYKFYEG